MLLVRPLIHLVCLKPAFAHGEPREMHLLLDNLSRRAGDCGILTASPAAVVTPEHSEDSNEVKHAYIEKMSPYPDMRRRWGRGPAEIEIPPRRKGNIARGLDCFPSPTLLQPLNCSCGVAEDECRQLDGDPPDVTHCRISPQTELESHLESPSSASVYESRHGSTCWVGIESLFPMTIVLGRHFVECDAWCRSIIWRVPSALSASYFR